LREQGVPPKTGTQLEREAVRRREEAARAHAKRSKRGLDRKDHDARFKKNLARVTGKDATGGKLLRQLAGRLEQARRKEEDISVTKTYALGMWLPGAYSTRNVLFALPADILPLGPERQLHVPDLMMQPKDRIALTGPNGGGKSTLIRHLVGITTLPCERLLYIPQEIDRHTAQELLTRVRGLPREQRGHLMTLVRRLGSRPPRLLETAEPSPGEIRKLLLALGIMQSPHLIIMDEPTNHLDLPSIACLEAALAECPCGLLLVSHDQYLLRRVTTTRWHIAAARNGEQNGDMRLRVLEPFGCG
jgi:ATPase subunit of ABC transporter with duplicated ATPase domains